MPSMNTMLAPVLPACPTALSEDQITQYHKDGWLAFENVLTAAEVEKARAAISDLIGEGGRDPGARKWRPGKFFIQFEPSYVPQENEPIDSLELKVRKLGSYHKAHPHFEYLALSHPRIQGVATSLLGANPILFQDMALIKPPFIGSEKPWHQDDAYFSFVPLGQIMGCWIALDDATVANGCMHVIPGGHNLGPKKHHHTYDCEIESGRINVSDAIPVEIPAGGAMFFHGLLPHQTPPNSSPGRRRALQFHYRGATTRALEREEYDKVFAESDGTPASCTAATPRK